VEAIDGASKPGRQAQGAEIDVLSDADAAQASALNPGDARANLTCGQVRSKTSVMRA